MVIKYKHFLFIFILTLTAQYLYAENLSFYRNKFFNAKEIKELEEETRQQFRTLKVAMRTVNLRVKTDFSRLTPMLDSDKSFGSSDFFKNVLESATYALKEFESYDTPMDFSPSKFSYELDKERKEMRKKITDKILKKSFDDLINQYATQVLKKKEDTKSESEKQKIQLAAIDIVERLTKYIKNNEPKEKQTILEKLGKIFNIVVEDGSIYKIKVTKKKVKPGREANLKDSERINLTLSMLINIRTEWDKYFILIQESFLELAQEELTKGQKRYEDLTNKLIYKIGFDEEKKKLANRLRILDAVIHSLKAKLQGAYFVYKSLNQLSKAQLNFLIDLFIQLRGTDLPSGTEEIGAEINRILTLIPSNRHGMESLNEKELEAYKDFWFYKKLQTELERLENYLYEEVEHNKTVKQVIKKIKEK